MKKVFKALIVITLLLQTVFLFSQTIYFGYAFDYKMAIDGPTAKSYEDIYGSHNFEIRAGLEFYKEYARNGIRVGFTAENHNLIGYFKGAIHADYMLIDWPLKGFRNYAGIQLGVIQRHDIPYKVNGGVGESGIQFTYDPESHSIGTIFEIQYEVAEYVAFGISYDIFWAEGALQDDAVVWADRWRTDVMVGIIFKIDTQ